jgi:cation-transporting ATPase E
MTSVEDVARRSPARTPPGGLTAEAVAERVRAGRVNAVTSRTSRPITAIIWANIFTPFNALLITLFVCILLTGRWQNGLFGLVVVVNSLIGIVQEIRAKRKLDRLTVVAAPLARVVRDGALREVDVASVVGDDIVELRAGDQVPTDGFVVDSVGLEVDESLLTGESDPIAKTRDDEMRSGSFVIAGHGRMQTTAVGGEAYAARLAAEAKRHTLVKSELVAGTNRLLRWISLVMLVVAPLLLWSQFRTEDNNSWQDAVTGTTAALVGMVPEGLVLLTSMAFLLATVTLARRQTLIQELPAVEVLARVDVVCLDKTGTLTYGDLVFDRLVPLGDIADADLHEALGLLAAGPDSNATALALAHTFGSTSWQRTGGVPFSSARKWSAVTAGAHGTWILGAPEMLLPDPAGELPTRARVAADDLASEGLRVLLLARTAEPVVPADDSGGEAQLPPGVAPAALVILVERIREDAAETLRFFTEQDVELRILSGDNPRTVGAVAAKVGIPGVRSASDAYDARELPDDLDEMADVLERHRVFGRVTPQQKHAVVAALHRRGHVVAMTGDGVNDVLAVKDADIGVSMGSGSAATKAVAKLVLIDGKFAHLPDVVAEGRRVIANIERAANLFLTKNVYSLVLALITAATLTAYPLAPIQLTLISTLTIGIPGAFLALGPNRQRYRPGFLRRVLRFALPAGTLIGVAAFTTYYVTRLTDSSSHVSGGRTAATITVLVLALWVLRVLAQPLVGWKIALFLVIAGIVTVIVVTPPLATGVFLMHPTPQRILVGLTIGGIGCVLLEAAYRAVTLASRGSRNE